MNFKKVKVKKKTLIAIVLLLASVGIFLQNNQKQEVPKETKVLVAKNDIPENTIVTKDMLKEDFRKTDDLMKQKEYITSNFENIVGRRTTTPLYKEEIVNLKRLIKNEDYMNEKDKKQLFVVPIDTTDKALDIKKGSYIDIWLEPNENAELEGLESCKLFERQKVYETKTQEYKTKKETNEEASKETAVTYLTLYLTNDEISKYLNVKDTIFGKRISLYGKNMDFKISQKNIKEQIKVEKENTKKDESVSEE